MGTDVAADLDVGAATDAAAVTISGMRFDAPTVVVKKGGIVTWTSNDAMPHTVTANNGSFGSPQLSNGATWSQTFDAVGTSRSHGNTVTCPAPDGATADDDAGATVDAESDAAAETDGSAGAGSAAETAVAPVPPVPPDGAGLADAVRDRLERAATPTS